MMSEPIQSAQSLRELADATGLRDEVLRVDVRPDLEGLRRDHNQVPLADRLNTACCDYAVDRIKDACPNPFRLPFS